MSLLIDNLIPRLKKFANHIAIKEALVDKVWTIYGDNDSVEYEFERTGEIVVTKNGQSYDGSWKILGSGRLQIKTDFSNNTLVFDFSVAGLLVMKKSGSANEPFLLYDPQIIKDGNIEQFLIEKEDPNTRLRTAEDKQFYKTFGPNRQT